MDRNALSDAAFLDYLEQKLRGLKTNTVRLRAADRYRLKDLGAYIAYPASNRFAYDRRRLITLIDHLRLIQVARVTAALNH